MVLRHSFVVLFALEFQEWQQCWKGVTAVAGGDLGGETANRAWDEVGGS